MTMNALQPPGDSLRALVAAPTIWAVHFLLCYIGAAVYCAKADPGAALDPVRVWVAIVTALALTGIAATGVVAFRHGGSRSGIIAPYDEDTEADRRRFLSIATLMLAGLSFVGTLFVGLPAIFMSTCQ